MITKERLKYLFNYNPVSGIFTRLVTCNNKAKAGTIAGGKDSRGYTIISIDHKLYKAHRLAFLYTYGYFPSKDVDHINAIRDDNRMSNLREATRSENLQNIRKPFTTNKSGFLGVRYHVRDKKWIAEISLSGKSKYLGAYKTPELASIAYITAKREMHNFCTI